MNILEICPFSAGGCGVWARVKRESTLLRTKGHNVVVFSSNFEKGTSKRVPSTDEFNGIKIHRFKATKLGGESYMQWNFKKEALAFNPDVIIAHGYRHLHTSKALKIARMLKCKVFLVTHAPFARTKNRSLIQNIIVKGYDSFIGPKNVNQFDKVLAISKWEIPYLHKLGVPSSKIVYSPNGITSDFFKRPNLNGEKNNIIFTGRIAPIKNIEVVIRAIRIANNRNLKLRILGPAEQQYKLKLEKLISKLNLKNKVNITDKKFDSKEEIKFIDSGAIFILPSLSEGMPQVLIEAMARSRLVICSDIPASKDIIINGKNGLLFQSNNEKDLANVLNKIDNMESKKIDNIRKNARKNAKQFAWEKLIDQLEKTIYN